MTQLQPLEDRRAAADVAQIARSAAERVGTPRRTRVLLVAALVKLPYRVLRCADAAGAEVWILGGPEAAGLKYSSRFKGYFDADTAIDGAFQPALAAQINELCDALRIDMVLPGDALATRSLIAIRSLVETPCFPLPDLAQFDLLNDKWRFAGLCDELGVSQPRTQLFDDVDALRRAIADGALDPSVIVKPLSMDSSVGCLALDPAEPEKGLAEIFYRPILVQAFIPGRDIGASVFCERGEVLAFVAHSYRRAAYRTFFDPDVLEAIRKIAWRLRLSGVYNFDMRQASDGQVYFLECNPRFFFKMALSMLAGMNFVALGLPGASLPAQPQVCDETVVQLPKAMLSSLPTPWRIGAKDWSALAYTLADPIPLLREQLGLEISERTRQQRRRASSAN